MATLEGTTSQHPGGDTSVPATNDYSGEAPISAAAPDPTPASDEPTRPARSRVPRRCLLAGGLTLVLAVPVGIGVAAAAGGPSPSGTGTGPGPHMTGTASCPATCSAGTAGGRGQHMTQMPHDPADMGEHRTDMMGGRGAMMGTPTAVPSSP